MPKYYITPFAAGGNRAPIPESVQPDGSVSYPSGYGVNYQLDQTTNPNALDVERTLFNELMYDATSNLQYYQNYSVPAFISSADNGGTPYPYAKKAAVRFQRSDSTYGIYQSLADNNIEAPEITTGVFSKLWQELYFKIVANDTGTTNNIKVLTGSALSVSSYGTTVVVKMANTNTGSTTIQIGGAEPVYTVQTGYNSSFGNVQAGMLLSGGTYEFVFNGTTYTLMNPTPLPATRPSTPVPHAMVTFTASQTQVINAGTTNQKIQFGRVESDILGWWDAPNFRFRPTYLGYYDIVITMTYSVSGGNPPITPGAPFQQVLSLRGNQITPEFTLAACPTTPATVGDRYTVTLVFNSCAFDGSTTYVYSAWTSFSSSTPPANTTLGVVPSPLVSDVTGVNTCTMSIVYRGTNGVPS